MTDVSYVSEQGTVQKTVWRRGTGGMRTAWAATILFCIINPSSRGSWWRQEPRPTPTVSSMVAEPPHFGDSGSFFPRAAPAPGKKWLLGGSGV